MNALDRTGKKWIAGLPLLVFLAVAGIFLKGLGNNDPSRIPSALIGKPAPSFALPPLEESGVPGFSSVELQGSGPTIVNVWASWCGPCRLEHPILMALKDRADVRLIGINYKDQPETARRFLVELGQPFSAIGVDRSGRTGIDWGVYGVPETFVVDRHGIVRFKWIGPLTEEAVQASLEPAIRQASLPR